MLGDFAIIDSARVAASFTALTSSRRKFAASANDVEAYECPACV